MRLHLCLGAPLCFRKEFVADFQVRCDVNSDGHIFRAQVGRIGGVPLIPVQIDISEHEELMAVMHREGSIEVGQPIERRKLLRWLVDHLGLQNSRLEFVYQSVANHLCIVGEMSWKLAYKLPTSTCIEHEHIVQNVVVDHCGRVAHEGFSKNLGVYEEDKRTHWKRIARRNISNELASRKSSVSPISGDGISFKRFACVTECNWGHDPQFFTGNEIAPWVLCQHGTGSKDILSQLPLFQIAVN